jgi:hypothetical protein
MPICGRIKIILIPPKSSKYLYAKTDYEAFEFLSPVSPWRVQDMYKADYAKIKTLEVQLVPGKIIFIPAYWWYSIKYVDDATLCTFKYRTYMNTVSILPPLFLHFLQRQNVKRSTVKQVVGSGAAAASDRSIDIDVDIDNGANTQTDPAKKETAEPLHPPHPQQVLPAPLQTREYPDAPTPDGGLGSQQTTALSELLPANE